jgi:hypothetical protein
MEENRCSMCGKPNSADDVVCQHCGARLTPVTPSNAGKFTGGLSWLDAFREETGSSGQGQPTREPEEPEAEDAPDWLQRIHERTDDESQKTGDPEIRFDDSEMDQGQDGGSDVPDWLRNLKEESGSAPNVPDQPIPHWTAALRTWTDEPKSDNEPQDEEAEPTPQAPSWTAALRSWTDEPGQEADEEVEDEEVFPQDQAPKVTDWFHRILPEDEKPAQDVDDYIEDRDEKVLMDDVDLSDWQEKSASLSSIRESKDVNEEVPSWLQEDSSETTEDASQNLMQWLQDLDEQEGGKGKQKARYWMGEVDTGELAKSREVDPRFSEKGESSLPVYDPFSGTETGPDSKEDAKSTHFFSESELDEAGAGKPPVHTVRFEGEEENQTEEDLPLWMRSEPIMPLSQPLSAPKMTAALDPDDEEIPDWMKDQPTDQIAADAKAPMMTAALSGLDDDALGMDLPADELPPWMKELADEPAVPIKPGPAMTAILDDKEENMQEGLGESPEPDLPDQPRTPILTAALSGLDDEDLGMDLPIEEPPPWMKQVEQKEPPQSAEPPLSTAALGEFDEEAGDVDEEIPPWLIEEDEIPPVRSAEPLMTAALTGLDDETLSAEDEIPPWMQDIEAAASPDRPAAPMMTAALSGLDEEIPIPDEETPVWMRDTEEVAPPLPTATPLMTAALSGFDDEESDRFLSDDELPDWMRGIEPDESQPLASAALDDTTAFETVPGEIIERESASSEPLMTAYFDELQEETELSAKDLDSSSLAGTPDEDEVQDGFPSFDALDHFLVDEPANEENIPVSASGDEIPDWLTSFADESEMHREPLDAWSEDSLLSESSPSLPKKEQQDLGNLLQEGSAPDWLAEMKQGSDLSSMGDKQPFTFDDDDEIPLNLDTSHPFAGDDLPNWLSPEIWQAEGKIDEAAPDEKEVEGLENIQWELEGLEKGELPSWFQQLKPGKVEKRKGAKSEPLEGETQAEKIGPLAGLMGVLPARDMDRMYRKPPIYSDQIQLTERQSNRLQVLTRMIEGEAKNQPLKVAGEKLPVHLVQILFAILLILLMLIPFSGILPMQATLPFAASDPVVAFYNQVEQYPQNSTVLMVMDFEAGYTAEMRSTLDGLLERLYEKQVNITMISTLPIGPVLAEEIAQDIWLKHFAAHPDVNVTEYESRVINLGYLPGGSTAMLQFLRYPQQTVQYGFRYEKNPTRIWDASALSAIQSVDDFAGVIVVTDSPTVSQNWIEQANLGSLDRLMMVTSAQTYSLILPYWQTGQVKGLIAGLYQGYTYRTLLNQSSGLAVRWYSYQFGMNLVTLITILLTLGFIVRNTFPGRKTPR